MKTKHIFPLLLIVILLLSSCRANISRNQDGSVDVETIITQQELQEAINAAIADPLIKDLTASLQNGDILVSGTRARLNDSSKTDTLNFRLDMGANNGQLTTSISNATLDGVSIEQNRVDHWNQTISNRIGFISNKSPNTTLKSVSITTSAVTMIWTVAK